MANVTATTADIFVDEQWSPELNRAIEYDTIIMGMFTDLSSRLSGSGDVFHWPARHNLTANTKSAGTDATPEAITETQQNFTVSTHQIVAQEIEDFAEIMSKYDIRNEFTMAAAYALARAQDVNAAALLDDNTTQTVGTLAAELSDDDLLSAWTYLRNAAARAPFKGVVSPAAWAGLLKIERFTQQLYNGDTQGKAIHEAQIGKVYQATLFVSQLTTGTSPSSSGAIWAGDHFFKIIKRAPANHAWYSPLATAWVVTSDTIYGVFEKEEANEGAALTTTSKLHGVRLQTLK